MTIRVGELCAGYSGMSMGLRLAGEDVDLRWLAEFDQALDPAHPAGVPNLGDITAIDWSAVEPVDLVTAGFPCQPFSAAGSQLAEADPRYLWPAVRTGIAALHPPRVLLENVRNLVSMRKGDVWAHILDDLGQLGYAVRWLTLGACAVGAAHHRHRVFALAEQAGYETDQVERLDIQECGARRGSVMVPTATMTDHKDSRNETSGRQVDSAHHGGTTLGDFAVIVGGPLLPTPVVRVPDHRGVQTQGNRTSPNLGPTLAALLPSPTASPYGSNQGGAAGRVGPVRHSLDSLASRALLPTPRASDHEFGGRRLGPDGRTPGGYGADLIDLAASNLLPAVALLPTPRATVDPVGGPGQRGSAGDLAMPSAVQPWNWGRFEAAVARHAAAFGPPPTPTEPNRNGAPRLAAPFAEWLMCIPAGYVTSILPRAAALKAIGNGVCPPQLAQAWRYLTGVDRPSDMSLESRDVTTETISEIQDRNALARGRVIATATGSTFNLVDDEAAPLIQAAMMELAAIWREEAAWFTAQKRKGHVGISKELTQAAARLAGFAVGLTTRPTVVSAGTLVIPVPADVHPPQCDCGRPECAALSLMAEALDIAPDALAVPSLGSVHDIAEAVTEETAAIFEAVMAQSAPAPCVHPDNARSTLKSGVIICTLCSTAVSQVVPPTAPRLDALVPGTVPGPVVTGDPTMDFLTGATDVYEPFGYVPHRLEVPAEMAANWDGEIKSTTIKEESPLQPAPVDPGPVAIDNPFTSPAPPGRPAVKRLTYGELGPLIAATYPVPRPHFSHSYVESTEKCGLSALLSDASRGGHVGPRRPSWSLIGGNAFHAAVEGVEQAALNLGGASPDGELGDWETYWVERFNDQITQVRDALAGTPYASIESWHIANKGLEGYDWWRVQGLDMLQRYLKHHDNAWRAQHTLLQVPADPTSPNANEPRVAVIELPFTVSAGSTAITMEGFIDAAWLSTSPDYPTATLEVVDYKAGKSLPADHFQLTEYGDVLRKYLPPNFALPIVGKYWRARLGAYTPPITLTVEAGRAEIDYRYQAADRAMRHAVFAPRVDNMCSSCGSVDVCPAQAMRDAS